MYLNSLQYITLFEEPAPESGWRTSPLRGLLGRRESRGWAACDGSFSSARLLLIVRYFLRLMDKPSQRGIIVVIKSGAL